MNSFITLDYELYFGNYVGSVEKCMIEPTNELIKVLDKYDVKATFFVDVGYLVKSDELNVDQKAANKVKEQLKLLATQGHDIQLHVHPHWEASSYNNGQWITELSKYKLSDFDRKSAAKIILKYQAKLNEYVGTSPISFRAGGWCIQPFEHFSNALLGAGIKVDSTIYTNGSNISDIQGYDFFGAPDKDYWRFDNDPLIPQDNGVFVELPISHIDLSPVFYWRFALVKKFGIKSLSSFGDGLAVNMSRQQLVSFLTRKTRTVASIDGYKASQLNRYRKFWVNKHGENANFVLIGHPKSLSPYSLAKLDNFLKQTAAKDNFMTISNWYNKYEKSNYKN